MSNALAPVYIPQTPQQPHQQMISPILSAPLSNNFNLYAPYSLLVQGSNLFRFFYLPNYTNQVIQYVNYKTMQQINNYIKNIMNNMAQNEINVNVYFYKDEQIAGARIENGEGVIGSSIIDATLRLNTDYIKLNLLVVTGSVSTLYTDKLNPTKFITCSVINSSVSPMTCTTKTQTLLKNLDEVYLNNASNILYNNFVNYTTNNDPNTNQFNESNVNIVDARKNVGSSALMPNLNPIKYAPPMEYTPPMNNTIQMKPVDSQRFINPNATTSTTVAPQDPFSGLPVEDPQNINPDARPSVYVEQMNPV